MFRILTTASIAALMSGAALAQDSGFYLSGDLGIAADTSDVGMTGYTASYGGTGYTDTETANVWGLGAGYAFDNNWRVEGEFRFRTIESDYTLVNGVDDTATGGLNRAADQFAFNADAENYTGMVNVYYDFNTFEGPVTPYLKAGVGFGHTETESTLDAIINSGINGFPPGFTFADYAYGSDSTTEFAWNVGGGLAYDINESLTLDLEYQYTDYGDAVSAYDDFGDAVSFDDFAGHELTVGVRYRF